VIRERRVSEIRLVTSQQDAIELGSHREYVWIGRADAEIAHVYDSNDIVTIVSKRMYPLGIGVLVREEFHQSGVPGDDTVRHILVVESPLLFIDLAHLLDVAEGIRECCMHVSNGDVVSRCDLLGRFAAVHVPLVHVIDADSMPFDSRIATQNVLGMHDARH
jgi:hypothetical protein